MTQTSPRLGLPYLMPSQAQKHVTHNEALQLLDQLVQPAVAAFGAEAPPAAPEPGVCYALGAAPAGAWAGQAGQLAFLADGAWRFLAPQEGWRAWDLAAAQLRVYRGGAWQAAVQQLDRLGIGTAPDAASRLAVAAEASLLSHAGGSHRLTVNKAAAADTASLLFQSGWTGHAEMGLAGDTAFAVKVSADGSAWHEAIRADPAAQSLSWAPAGPVRMALSEAGLQLDVPLGGTAVQAAPGDVTPGRLMRADYGYGPGNLVGTVSESGGQPAGAAIERGSGAGGAYLRLADGTQLCWASTASGSSWSFPAAFAAPPVVTASAAAAAPRMTAVSGLSAAAAVPRAYDAGGTEQAGETLHCLAAGRWF